MTTAKIPRHVPIGPKPPPALNRKRVTIEVTVTGQEPGILLVSRPHRASARVPELLTEHAPFDGRIRTPTKIALILPIWLAEDVGLRPIAE